MLQLLKFYSSYEYIKTERKKRTSKEGMSIAPIIPFLTFQKAPKLSICIECEGDSPPLYDLLHLFKWRIAIGSLFFPPSAASFVCHASLFSADPHVQTCYSIEEREEEGGAFFILFIFSFISYDCSLRNVLIGYHTCCIRCCT